MSLSVGRIGVALTGGVPLWLTLVREAESAAAAAGASLWYVPPEGYAPRAVNGPFVGSDGSGGVPALGSGPVGYLTDRQFGAASGFASPYNLLRWSEDFTAGAWSKAQGATSPNASTITFAALPESRVEQSRGIVLSAGQSATFSVELRAAAPTTANIAAGGNRIYTLVNVTTDWQRFTVTRTATGSEGALGIIANVGSAAGTIEARRAQLNYGTSATAYVATTAVENLGPGSHATQSTSANRPVLVAAPGAAAAAAGFAAPLFDSTDLLVAPLASSGTPGYFDVLDNGTERTTPAAATTTTVTLQAPNTRQLLVAVAHPTAVPANVVTAARALANFMRGV